MSDRDVCSRGYAADFEKVCFAPFRYCPEKGCGRMEVRTLDSAQEVPAPTTAAVLGPEDDTEAMRAFLKIRTAQEQEQIMTQWDVYLNHHKAIRAKLDDPNYEWNP